MKTPAPGHLDVVQPNLIAYTPRAGFTGQDEFAYGGSGPGRDGRILPFSVRSLGPRAGPGRSAALIGQRVPVGSWS
ncbi:MAG: Ig-like domain-containing protein, partial [Candidatus Rokuibacteriota bacterium]